MIYLTFDSNIWIYLLNDSWKENNPLDYLEHWIEEGHITILLPEIILSEWDRNRDKEKVERKKKLKEFFLMADEIIPLEFIKDQRKPENIDKIVENQFIRIENLIKSKAKIIPLENETKFKLIEWGVLKKAPMHKKSSVADAIIILSLFDFVEQNLDNEFIFITENTEDFYQKVEKKQSIHPDLQVNFEKLKIADYRNLNYAMHYLKGKLPVTIDINSKKENRIKNQVSSFVHNPSIVKKLNNFKDIYLEDIKHLELIVKSENPTKQGILFVLGVLDTDINLNEFFFKNVENPVWFSILKDNEIFNPEKNPEPIQTDEGFQITRWNALIYLEKLSYEIPKGKYSELVDEMISIIRNISEKPIDNFRTWGSIITILQNLPNNKIPKDIFQFLPVWFDSKFDTMFQSMGVCEKLLPKFLNEEPTKEDIKKAELILNFLFSIEKTNVPEELWNSETVGYRSKVYLHYLSEVVINQKLDRKIAEYCSSELILELGITVKKLMIDYPRGINTTIENDDKIFEVKIFFEETNLRVLSKLKDSSTLNKESIIENYEIYSEEELKVEFTKTINNQGINYEVIDDIYDTFKILYFALYNDKTSTFGHDSISEMSSENQHDEKVLDVFTLIFRNLLINKTELNPVGGLELLRTFCFDPKFRNPFYKRISLYVISENWAKTQTLFWELIGETDSNFLFSIHSYQNELYELLNKNQGEFGEDEKRVILNIISNGQKDDSEKNDEDYQKYWQLKWFSPLKDTIPFKERYLELSAQLNITNEHFESFGKVRWRRGSVPPFEVEQILEMSNENLVNYIHAFKPKDRQEEPTISGLADILGKAVEINPSKFASQIELYNDVYYIYVYHIINGFKKAWHEQKELDWKKILDFCKHYIENDKFYSEGLKIENDSWNANSDWVKGSIATLISEMTNNDNKRFSDSFISVTKDILFNLTTKLKPIPDHEETKEDYPMYSINSTSGKVLRALFDYSMFRARTLTDLDKKEKWEADTKIIFEETLRKGLIDGYILQGMYFQQFYFLDEKWIKEQIKNNINLPENEWRAFMGGLSYGSVPFNKEIYELFYPHYEKVIDTKIELKSRYNHGLIGHLAVFYLWEYEDLSQNRLVMRFLEKSKTNYISDFVLFICQQEEYTDDLNDDERANFDKIILELWSYLSKKYEKSKNIESQKILGLLSKFLFFVPQLNEKYVFLTLQSCKHLEKTNYSNEILKNLVPFIEGENPEKVAFHIGQIVPNLKFSEHLSEKSKKNIRDLVNFLLKYNQKQVALSICNVMAMTYKQFFLRDIYDENT
jgi:hypothetical protein